jgi:predicted amidophosphoribosyltransferase
MSMICLTCNGDRGGNFCSKCGSKLIEDPNTRRCPACGVEVYQGDFCFICGWELAKPVPPIFVRFWQSLKFLFRGFS